jgi:GNAT superfamily N-acetyltransferase
LASVLALAALALVLARIAGRRGAWPWVLGAVVLVMLAAQVLPAGHPFRVETAAWGRNLFWIGLGLLPVGAYALWIRKLRRRTGVDDAPAVPQGLVQFPDDAALAAETAAALLAEAPGARLTLGWRDETGALRGALRLRIVADLAEVELLRVAPEARRQGLGARLLKAAEREARIGGAARIGALVAPWQGLSVFRRAGFVPGAEAGGRLWLEKAL